MAGLIWSKEYPETNRWVKELKMQIVILSKNRCDPECPVSFLEKKPGDWLASGEYSNKLVQKIFGKNRKVTLWMEGVSPLSDTISFSIDPDGSPNAKEENLATYMYTDIVDVSPVNLHLDSKDRMFHCSISAPEKIKDISFTVKNNSDSQNLGSFILRSSSGQTSYIYESEDDIFSEEEMTLEENGILSEEIKRQRVAIVKDKDNPSLYHIYGIFNNLGGITVEADFDGAKIEKEHTLTSNNEFSQWIDYTSWWIALDLSTPPIITTTTSAVAQAKIESLSNSVPDENRGMVAKALILAFKRTVNPPIALVKGLFNGIIDGLKDDINCGVAVAGFLNDIRKGDYPRASELYHAIKEINLGNIYTMIGNSMDSLVSQADAAVPWTLGTDVGNYPAVSSYIAGYVFGYAVEQIAACAVGAGVVAKVGKGVKCLMEACKGGRLVLTGLSGAKQFSLSFFRSASMKVVSIAEVVRLTDMLFYLKKYTYQGLEYAGILKRYDNWMAKVIILRAGINGAWDTVGRRTMERLAELTQKMYTEMPYMSCLTSDACEGFLKAYPKRLYISRTKDRLDDLLKLFKKGNGSTNYASLNDSFQKFKNAVGDKPKLYIVDPETTFPKGYRYADDNKLVRDILDGKTDRLPVCRDPKGYYFSFDEYAKSEIAKAKLQLPKQSTAKYRLEVDVADVKNNTVIPYGKLNTSELLEPICKDYPKLGLGGGTQVLIENIEIKIRKIWDISGDVPKLVYSSL